MHLEDLEPSSNFRVAPRPTLGVMASAYWGLAKRMAADPEMRRMVYGGYALGELGHALLPSITGTAAGLLTGRGRRALAQRLMRGGAQSAFRRAGKAIRTPLILAALDASVTDTSNFLEKQNRQRYDPKRDRPYPEPLPMAGANVGPAYRAWASRKAESNKRRSEREDF